MKRVVSILILLVLLFFVSQWGLIFFKKGHEISYQVFFEDIVFDIYETYQKEPGDIYDILIKDGKNVYSYVISNKYNKQKKIIKQIEYYHENDNYCIYPILTNGEGTYLECSYNDQVYSAYSFPDQNFVSKIRTNLKEKGYSLLENPDYNNTISVGNSTVYSESLLSVDTITLWNYKGIELIGSKNSIVKNTLSFDKYQNEHGALVGKYYIIPNYLSDKVQEFSSVTIINLDNKDTEKIELGYTLASNTYINGVLNQKLYYTDPTNLLQIEINPSNENVRLIGSKDIGGQLYQGSWKNINIYDFSSNKLLFQEEIPKEVSERYSYQQLLESNRNYYFYTNTGEIYRVPKNHLDTSVLLLKANNLNNFKVIQDTVYFVVNDTLYYFQEDKGMIAILKNNELRYNTLNRINIYRKS